MTSVDIVPTPEADPSRSIRSDRMVEIDVAKGIAISLVAWGHLVGRGIHPSGETWIYVFYGWKEHLYSFHLSVFFFLGGIVFFACPVGKRLARFRNTAVKMISAYVLFLFGVYFSARILSGFVRVSLPIGNPWDDLGYALLYPTESFVSYLWFIPCFLALMAIGTLTSGLSSSMRRFIIFASFLFLPLSAFEQVSKLFEFNQIARYLFFFLLGEYYLLYRARLLETLRSTWVLWFSAFIVSLMVFDLSGRQVVSALLSLPALVGLSVFLKNCDLVRRALIYLGRNTFTIYILNTPSLALLRSVVLKVWSWDDWRFAIVAPVLFLGGLLLPILIQRRIFSRWPWLDRVTR